VKGFFKVLNAIIGIGLTSNEIHVYIVLANWGNNGRVVRKSYKQIAERCGLSKPTVVNAIEILSAGALISKTVRKAGKKSNYVNKYKVHEEINQDISKLRIEQERVRQREEKRYLVRLEKKGRLIEESVQAQEGVTKKKASRLEAIEVGREIEAEQRKAKEANKWAPVGGAINGI